MKNNKQRVFYFDVLNILAILAVIYMHCNGIVHGNPNIRAWNSSLVVDCIMYWAVPIFFMLAGANLLNYRKRYTTKVFFKKRFTKVLIPFVFWAIFMFFWKSLTHQLIIDEFSIKNILNMFFLNTEEPTYYFMFDILGVYLTIPLLSLLTEKDDGKTLWLTIILFIIFNSFLPNILCLFGIYYNNSLSVQFGGYIVYVLLGYLLSTKDIDNKYKYLIYAIGIIGLVFRYVTTFIFSKEAGSVVTTTWGYTQWHCIFLSVSVFLFFKNSKINGIADKPNVTKAISKIASCSFGIYLIHFIIRHCYIFLFNIDIYTWHFRVFGALVVYIISLCIILVMKKIPIINKLVP